MAEKKQMRSVAIILAAILLIAVGVTASIIVYIDNTTDASMTDKIGGDFRLQSSRGPISLSQFRGQVVPLFFGYTHCPDVCPTTMSNVAEAMSLLTVAEQSRVQPLFITVDPERDTVDHLSKYVAFFHPKLIGLSGSLDAIREVAAKYSVEFFRDKSADIKDGYLISHTSYLFLISAEGEVVDLMSEHTKPSDIAETLRQQIPSL